MQTRVVFDYIKPTRSKYWKWRLERGTTWRENESQLNYSIALLPQGYAEQIGDDGIRLYGCQQLLLLARTLLREPSFLILY